ncbi:hypothetical protein GLYMA_18G095300v4 [Glycine max]|uniref:tetraacyldisaccharide 4'-kinase n=1 Tax=Glycine max TaxID=3847 RepID=K7MQV3_SOYBN|nr:hypothetical protein GLYMA_18G095300v4 [Glycine max]
MFRPLVSVAKTLFSSSGCRHDEVPEAQDFRQGEKITPLGCCPWSAFTIRQVGYGGGDEVNMLRRLLLGTPTKFGVGANGAGVASHFIQKYGCIDIDKSSWHEKQYLDQKVQDSLDSEKVGVVVLDDAMVNGLTLWGNLQLLPCGPLREPLTALRRADAVVIHHADLVSEHTLKDIESIVLGIEKSVPIFLIKMDPTYLFEVGTINVKILLTALHEATILCVSAIGSAEPFVKQIQKMGALYVDRIDFSDHHLLLARIHFSPPEFGSTNLLMNTMLLQINI